MSDNIIDCKKLGCGYGSAGVTRKQSESRMLMHLQRDDHSYQLKQFVAMQAAR
jgi:hypothetical protein